MMDTRDRAHEHQQGRVPPHSLSLSYPEPPGTSVPQGENSGKGFYAPSSVPPSNTFLPRSHSIPSSGSHTFPGAPSLMAREDSQPDPPGPADFPSSTLSPTTQPHLNPHSLGCTRQPHLRTNPSDPTASSQSHPATHRPEPHTIPSTLDEFVSPTRPAPAPPSSFPIHPLPPHLATGPPNNLDHRDHFPSHYAVPPPFQNQPFQPHFYYQYHSDHISRYVPFAARQPPPYFWQPGVDASPASYQQAQTHPIPIPQLAISNPAPHVGPYSRVQQYVPRIYSPPPGQFGSLHNFQPNVSRWYYGPGSAAEAFAEDAPPQAHYHYSADHGRTGARHLHRDSSSFRSRDSERLPSSGLGPGSSSVAVTAPPTATSATTMHSLEEMPVQDSPKIETQELAGKSETGTSHTHSDRPAVRRSYHPDPPPNRSEWVMWVGNVPSDVTHDELWRFLTYATPMTSGSERSGRVNGSGVMSIFLIPRSNCAFVNYLSEERLSHAIAEFSGRKLRPQDRRCPRLVCRERRKEDDLRAGVGAQRGRGVHTGHVKHILRKDKEPAIEATSSKCRKASSSTIPTPPSPSRDEGLKSDTSPKVAATSASSYASTNSSFLARHFPRRFFILKSLTQYDLDLSVERGVWATQKHNETILDQAYRTSKEVILIFSVNKSGEFYGYARMTSGILRSEYNISWAPRADLSPSSTSSPSSNSFPAQSSPEQSKRPSSQNPQMYTVPEGKLPEVSSSSLVFPLDPDLPPFHPGSGDPGEKEGPRVVLPSNAEPRPILLSKSGKDFGERAGPRTKGPRVDDTVNRGSRLQPVVEQASSGSGVGENLKLASAGMPPEALRGQDGSWGETFSIEWLSTQRAPFGRTRHLRNPWNHGREIKVSRDGTELEPGVGQRLIDEWRKLASGAGKRGAKSAAAPGSEPSGGSKDVKEERS